MHQACGAANHPDCDRYRQGAEVIDNYRTFLSTVLEMVKRRKALDRRCNVFTTNYDGCFPLVADELLKEGNTDFVVNDGARGFTRRILQASNFGSFLCQAGVFGRYQSSIPQINLIHLHGSVYWNKIQGAIQVRYDLSERPSLIEADALVVLQQFSATLANPDATLADLRDPGFSDETLKEFWDKYEQVPIVNPTQWKFHETVYEEHYYQMLRLLSYELEKPNAVLVTFGFSFAGFMDALRDAKALMLLKSLSIETVDSKVLMLAMKDIVWHGVAEYFPEDPSTPTLGINLIEFSGDDEAAVQQSVHDFVLHLQRDTSVVRLGHTLAVGADALKRVYAMRKLAVGLLGNVKGEARPQPFVEDTAVPPEHLADFIQEFRALLDSYELQYGMFGHVDAGVLHVRPILDMKDPVQAALIRPISDAVAALTQKHSGLLWGEHGKGLRSQYVPDYFGDLYPALQELKAAFDPHNQLNPGKIATPKTVPQARLTRVDGVELRGDLDRAIDERVWQSYDTAVHCNGNGACYNFDPDDAMCPSWKGTRNRVHSPKGRASLIREWLRLQGQQDVDVVTASDHLRSTSNVTNITKRVINTIAQKMGQQDFSHEVYDAMAGCLACKSCAGQCPVKVNVPEFRSRFLELYHSRYLRPLKDYLIGSLEYTIPYIAQVPRLYNFFMGARPVRFVLEHVAGMVDSPLLSMTDFDAVCRRWGVEVATPELLSTLGEQQRAHSVIIVQDAFTRYFETPVLSDWIELISRLGYKVYIAPFAPNGKPLQVQGFIKAFEKAAHFNSAALGQLQCYEIPLVGLNPAMTLVYRQEYEKTLGSDKAPTVLLPQEWLAGALPQAQSVEDADPYHFLPHCTEKTNEPSSIGLWQQVYERMGLKLNVQASGCCGMSGTYGHETQNAKTSDIIYSQSWGPLVEKFNLSGRLLADGYSCRSQVKRKEGVTILHPLQALLAIVRESTH